MKKINLIVVVGIIIAGLGLVTGFDKDYYSKENETSRAKIEDLKNSSDLVKSEFTEKLLNKKDQPRVNYYQVKSLDNSINYTQIQGFDTSKNITIDGKIWQNGGNIFINKDNQLYWLDIGKNIYYGEKRTSNYSSSITRDNDLTYGEKEVIKALGESNRKIEKIDGGYKSIIDDDLNYGYEIYDENGDFISSYLENSQGNVTTTLIESKNDVEDIYNYYLAKIDSMTKVETIEDIK